VNEIRLDGKNGFCPRDTCLAAFVQPRKSHGQRRNFGTSTEKAIFVPVLIETIHTLASLYIQRFTSGPCDLQLQASSA
ncbi:MAG TPA: hypothetical protein VNT29_10030, partial [Candidatus Limnocylindrales bacterium]|nr:hypothetical protein [Candidatus Limnocylindrales bacterium]